jgi:hypothetical protein
MRKHANEFSIPIFTIKAGKCIQQRDVFDDRTI